MSYSVPPLARLVEQLERLPGIGHKSAQRLAFFILELPDEAAGDFVSAITEAREKLHECAVCCDLTDQELCPVCRSAERDETTVCVVEDPRDVMALERTREYNGLYHVLHGAISPMDGIGPDRLRIKQLPYPDRGKTDRRGDYGDQPHRGGGGHRHVSRPAAQAL